MSTPPNVALRAEEALDEDVLYRIEADLETWELRTAAPPAPLTLEAYRARRSAEGEAKYVDFVITLDGAAVGRCTIFHEDPLARTAEVGISLAAEARGRGVGTAALRQLVEFAFVRRNLRRVHLITLATNQAAIAAYRKVGFVEEGRRREHCWVRGEYVDEVLMGLLRSEWAS